MISEHDLNEAIAKCQGTINPTSNTCLKLASYLVIKDHMYNKQEMLPMIESSIIEDTIQLSSGSEFAETVNGKKITDVIPVIDELMVTLQIVNPRLYNSVINKL